VHRDRKGSNPVLTNQSINQYPEDGDRRLYQNVGTHLTKIIRSHSCRDVETKLLQERNCVMRIPRAAVLSRTQGPEC
jgi:hypothetical protein